MHNHPQLDRIAKQLRGELAALREAIEGSTRYQRKRDKQQEEADERPAAINISAELCEPDAVQRDRQARDDRRHRQQKWLTWGTWLAFIAAAVYALIAAFQLREMRAATEQTAIAAAAAHSAAETAKEQLEMSERPLILPPEVAVSGPLTFENGKVVLHLRATYKNEGHSIAMSVTQLGNAMATPWKDPDKVMNAPLERQKTLCEPLKRMDTPGPALLPGRTIISDQTLYVGTREIEDSIPPPTNIRTFGPILIIGCVDYRFSFSPEHHQSGFIFELTGPHSGLFAVGRTVPAKELELRRWDDRGLYVT